MTERLEIGKIKSVKFGAGGYDDAMLGVSFTLGSDKTSWGVGDFFGTWASPPSEHAKWTVRDQTKTWGEMVRRIGQLLIDANVSDISKLVGKPVEVTFENGTLKSWRILTEVI
jgi:hypothetical protein